MQGVATQHSEFSIRHEMASWNALAKCAFCVSACQILSLGTLEMPGPCFFQFYIGLKVLQTHIKFPRFLPIFPDFLEQLSHLAPIY